MDDEAADLALAKAEPRTPAGGAAAARALGRHRGLIVKHCERVVMAGYELDDLIQEAHLAGLEAIRYFDAAKGFQFSTYLMDCVRKRVARWMKDRRHKPLPQEGDEESLDMCPAHEAVDAGFLAAALEKLDPMDREVLTLKFGLSGGGVLEDGAIARRLGVSSETVEWVGWQAGRRLKELLTPEGVADRPPLEEHRV